MPVGEQRAKRLLHHLLLPDNHAPNLLLQPLGRLRQPI
jgi:hypothetical protein